MSENDTSNDSSVTEQPPGRPSELEGKLDEMVESGPVDTGEGGKGMRVETSPTEFEAASRGEGSEHPQASGGQGGT